ncbi:MAG: GH3 auxin-responsive promoter family protein [Flavobacteriales bacterium]|nr:GH3 auxin-responsive promoter family protein [Flavobacteriales bacterium]
MMPLNSVFGWFMKKRIHQIELFMKYPVEVQHDVFRSLVDQAALTRFGLEHHFSKITTVDDFKKAVPIRNYESFKPYVESLREGQQNVLWPSKLKWFAKSSGTTDDRSKYIPVTKEALEECHYKGGKDLLALYYNQKPNANIYSGKHLVLGGSSKINAFNEEGYTGDLSAIIIRNLPIWVELRRTPSRDIALMDNWEEKIERIAQTTMNEDIYMMAGVPSWTLVLLKRILELKGTNNIREVWPNLELFWHGGVSFKPYRDQFEALIPGSTMSYVETYNASEGFFGIQDRLDANDLLLMLDYGIFYEFMPMSEYGKAAPKTIGLKDVVLGENYALIISTNGGLWRYLVGDTVRFTSTYPFRIQVSGRTRHYINAFGEELMVDNADEAIRYACQATASSVTDYTAAPVYMTGNSTGAHEWLIEFDREPGDINQFKLLLDKKLREVNSDYDAKRAFDFILREPLVRVLPKGTFYNWLREKDKLGGQHKVPRLCNDRRYIDEVSQHLVSVVTEA